MSSISLWADQHRSPATARWHYVNLPKDDCHYVANRDCPDGHCVVAAIERQAERLRTATSDAERLVSFAADLTTQVGSANLLARVETIRQGRARTPPTPAEAAAVAFTDAPGLSAALHLLQQLEDQAHARVFRPEMLHCSRTAMRAAASGGTTLLDAVLQARERNRHLGRPVSRRAVGSTLLLKGLEADVAVILHPEMMDAPNLYVALTRGARRLVVCSDTPVLRPAA